MWIGENTQRQRPTKREREQEAERNISWQCRGAGGHAMEGDKCSRCGHVEEPSPFAHIECAWCREIAEETGAEHGCPIHSPAPLAGIAEAAQKPALLAAPDDTMTQTCFELH